MRLLAGFLRRLLTVALLLVLVAAVGFVALEPVRAGFLTMALVPDLLDAGPRPLSALAPPPERTSVAYGAARSDRLDLYLPAGEGARRPAVLLVLGVNRVALDHPVVVRVATAIARLGVVVAVPESAELKAGRLAPDEVGHLVEAFEAVSARREVLPDRIGLVGVSAGGSLALLAAADARIADRVAWVNAFGAYGDAATLMSEIATRRIVVEGTGRSWQPGELTRGIFRELLVAVVAEAAARDPRLQDPRLLAELRARLEPIVAGDGPTPDDFDPALAERLQGDALAVYRLVTAPDRATADAALAMLSEPAQALLRDLSPVRAAGRIRAPVWLMHDQGDDAIPISQLGPLREAIPPDRLRAATVFDLFDHVQPRGGVGAEALPELLRLWGHVREVLEEAL
ncbi:MAG TPA: hypothetical protein VFK38_03550 [Candidatus Limnocylindrales bacterium]|nr:hypothetical protein [Candidatus Limnocylindrales bacterium]